jgi:excisionase family DNA binding protein
MQYAEKGTPIFTLVELSKQLQCSPGYLANEIRRGRLAAYRFAKGWRVSRAQLDEWLRMVESRSKIA